MPGEWHGMVYGIVPVGVCGKWFDSHICSHASTCACSQTGYQNKEQNAQSTTHTLKIKYLPLKLQLQDSQREDHHSWGWHPLLQVTCWPIGKNSHHIQDPWFNSSWGHLLHVIPLSLSFPMSAAALCRITCQKMGQMTANKPSWTVYRYQGYDNITMLWDLGTSKRDMFSRWKPASISVHNSRCQHDWVWRWTQNSIEYAPATCQYFVWQHFWVTNWKAKWPELNLWPVNKMVLYTAPNTSTMHGQNNHCSLLWRKHRGQTTLQPLQLNFDSVRATAIRKDIRLFIADTRQFSMVENKWLLHTLQPKYTTSSRWFLLS